MFTGTITQRKPPKTDLEVSMGRSGRLLIILIFILLLGSACVSTSPPDTAAATLNVIPVTTIETLTNEAGEPSLLTSWVDTLIDDWRYNQEITSIMNFNTDG
jgi:hypothetical protein